MVACRGADAPRPCGATSGWAVGLGLTPGLGFQVQILSPSQLQPQGAGLPLFPVSVGKCLNCAPRIIPPPKNTPAQLSGFSK